MVVFRNLCGPMHDVYENAPGTSMVSIGDSTSMLDKLIALPESHSASSWFCYHNWERGDL